MEIYSKNFGRLRITMLEKANKFCQIPRNRGGKSEILRCNTLVVVKLNESNLKYKNK